jgi:hypothetical protein
MIDTVKQDMEDIGEVIIMEAMDTIIPSIIIADTIIVVMLLHNITAIIVIGIIP